MERMGGEQCFPFPGIGPDAESNPATLRIKYGINPGISGIYPIPAAESKVGYIPPFWHATVARPCVLVRAESMPKAAKHGLGKSLLDELVQRTLDGSVQALPRGGPCPPGGHCAALDGPTRLRSPSTRSPRSGAPRAPRGATSRRCGGRPASRAGRQPERRRCGGRGRGRGRQPRGRRLLRALRAGANWPPPNSHPSTHGRDAPGDAIDRGHMERKNTVHSRVRICLIYKSLFLCA